MTDPTPKQLFNRAKVEYEVCGKELADAQAKCDITRKDLDDLLSGRATSAIAADDCAQRLAIAESATLFAAQKDQEAAAANADAVAAGQLRDSAWAYYWAECD